MQSILWHRADGSSICRKYNKQVGDILLLWKYNINFVSLAVKIYLYSCLSMGQLVTIDSGH